MKLSEVSSKPVKTAQGTFKQIISCYKIEDDKDAEELCTVLSSGVEVLPSYANGKYAYIKKVTKLPFDIHGGSTKNLKAK